MAYEEFLESVKKSVEEFNKLDKNKVLRVISHLDSDGICAASLLINALNIENRKYSLSIIKQLDRKILKQLARERYECVIFTDLGSGQLDIINEELSDRKVFVLDHHEIKDAVSSDNLIVLNPHLNDIDGSKNIAGSGVVYHFVKELNEKNKEMAHLAVIGAIGDVQENGGFSDLNQKILDDAVESGKIQVSKGLRLFGTQTRPLVKVLEYCYDPYIPDVSGSESGVVHFLKNIGIDPQINGKWKKISDLSEEEMKKLASGIIMKRVNEDNPEDVFGNIYILPNEKEGPLRDAKEFSTLLNACGRLGKASLGIGACIGDKRMKIKALNALGDYKKEIINAMRWYHDNKENNDFVIRGEGYIIINAQENIMATMIGTLASMLSKSKEVGENTYIMSMAHNMMEETTKVSLRIAGLKISEDLDLREVVNKLVSEVGGEAGGHKQAAGAIIPSSVENQFIESAKRVLSERSMEIKVV